MHGLIKDAQQIVEGLYLPDLLAIASFYPEWTTYGGGLGNYMAYGDIPQNGVDDPSHFRFPRGVILNQNLAEVLPLDPTDTHQIQEEVAHSWYKYPNGAQGLHPSEGITDANYTGPKPPFAQLDENGGYSLVKAPRWKGNAMEVGPLARMLVGFASGRTEYKDVVTDALGRLKLTPACLFSTLGRTAARGLETRLAVRWLAEEYDRLIANLKAGDTATADTKRWDPKTWPAECQGLRRRGSAARGARPLGPHSRRQDRQLPDRGSKHLERIAQGRQGPTRRLRSRAARYAHGGPETAGRDPAHHTLVRSVPGLRHARHQSRRRDARRGHSAVGGTPWL